MVFGGGRRAIADIVCRFILKYCAARKLDVATVDAEWTFWKGLTWFRTAAISHGVYCRGLAGNAGSTLALQAGANYVSAVGLAIAIMDAEPEASKL